MSGGWYVDSFWAAARRAYAQATDERPLQVASAASVAVEPNRVTLVSDLPSQLTMLVDGDPDQAVDVGGWESTEREGLPAARWWKAPGDGSLVLSLAIDTRLIGGSDMARRLVVLADMGRKPTNKDEPPKLRVVGGNLPLAENQTWIMQGLTLGARVVVGGVHFRQSVSVTLEPFDGGDSIDRVKQGRTRDAKGARRVRYLRTKQGDTLRAIAVRQLGSAGEWKSIREWNKRTLGKVDPDAPLRAGIKVVLK